jgi:hypothetical protein
LSVIAMDNCDPHRSERGQALLETAVIELGHDSFVVGNEPTEDLY